MYSKALTAAVLFGLAVGLLATVQAQEGKRANAVSAKPAKSMPATSVAFGKDLGVGLVSLNTLGFRIEQARKDDPVGLASLANELAAAEEVSGKKAKLTAEKVAKEAIALATQRRDAVEQKTVAALLRHNKGMKEEVAQLQKQAIATAEADEDAAAKAKEGERARGIQGYLTVQNSTAYTMDVYASGRYMGWVNPYRDYTFSYPVGHGPTFNTVLMAYPRGNPDQTWGPYIVNWDVQDFTWNLNP